MADDDLRTRIATTLYGDGNELPWTRCIEHADLLIWEFGLRDEWMTRKSLTLGIVKLTKPHDAIATRVGSTWKEINQ